MCQYIISFWKWIPFLRKRVVCSRTFVRPCLVALNVLDLTKNITCFLCIRMLSCKKKCSTIQKRFAYGNGQMQRDSKVVKRRKLLCMRNHIVQHDAGQITMTDLYYFNAHGTNIEWLKQQSPLAPQRISFVHMFETQWLFGFIESFQLCGFTYIYDFSWIFGIMSYIDWIKIPSTIFSCAKCQKHLDQRHFSPFSTRAEWRRDSEWKWKLEI